MINDPIIAEVRRNREKLAKKYGSLKKYAEYLRKKHPSKPKANKSK